MSMSSPLEFVNPTPTLLNLKLLVSLKDLALEWTCMASWKARVNCYKFCVFAFPRKHQSKGAHHLLRGWYGDFKIYTSCELISRWKNVARKYLAKQILKNKTTSGYRKEPCWGVWGILHQKMFKFGGSKMLFSALVMGPVSKKSTLNIKMANNLLQFTIIKRTESQENNSILRLYVRGLWLCFITDQKLN